MYHGSLFSGGGGFDLAAEAMGWQNVFHVENDPFCQSILKHYWPDAHSHQDIRQFDATPYEGKIDVLTGGFPCQPFSNAGKRRGTADDRYLWPEMLRVVSEVKPRWVVGENVYGLINWNGGLVFDQVLSELEAQGYEVWPYVLPAAGINAPHQRYRVWIVAFNGQNSPAGAAQTDPDTAGAGRHVTRLCCEAQKAGNATERGQADIVRTVQLAEADTAAGSPACGRPDKHQSSDKRRRGGRDVYASREGKQGGKECQFRQAGYEWIANTNWRDWPAQSPLCSRNDGLSLGLDGKAFEKWRTQSLKMFGNAIVPQLVLQLFKAIERYERGLDRSTQIVGDK